MIALAPFLFNGGEHGKDNFDEDELDEDENEELFVTFATFFCRFDHRFYVSRCEYSTEALILDNMFPSEKKASSSFKYKINHLKNKIQFLLVAWVRDVLRQILAKNRFWITFTDMVRNRLTENRFSYDRDNICLRNTHFMARVLFKVHF